MPAVTHTVRRIFPVASNVRVRNLIVTLPLILIMIFTFRDNPRTQPDLESQIQTKTYLQKTALYFEPNAGQTDETVKFIANGSRYSLLLESDGTLRLRSKEKSGNRDPGQAAMVEAPSATPDVYLQNILDK